jgi:hypothetical protein
VNGSEPPMKKLLIALPLLACFALPARGEGAIAIAIPDEGLRKGFAYGWHMRAKTAEDARKEALEACRDNAKSNGIPPGKCKVVEVFKGQCVAVAHDRHTRGYLPASTFKIPNALIALETGVVKDADNPVRTKRPRRPARSNSAGSAGVPATPPNSIATADAPQFRNFGR